MSHYKPYPVYRDSGVEWIGRVPEHWKKMPFKRLASICNGQDYKDVEDADGAYPVIGSGGEFARASSFLFDGESVLLGRKGTIDKPLYINGPFWAVDTMFYTKIVGHAFPKFVYYTALTIPFSRYSTNTALPSMTGENLSSHVIAAPEISEQQVIATSLDRETFRIDALIAKKTRFIELLKEKRQALITHAVTKGLDPNVKMKDSGVEWIGEVPEHWRTGILKRFIVFQRGHDLPSELRGEGTVPVVSSGGYTGTHNVAVAKAPGIVTGRYGSLGEFTFVEKDYWPLNTALYSIQLFDNDPRFVWYLLQHISDLFLLYSAKAAVPGIDRNDIHEIFVAAPQHDEQEQIAQRLDKLSDRITTLTEKTQRSIDLLKERRAAFITAAVTGQIDLRGSA
ncbi:restriction endonuclease subunit S [Chitinivorax sp. PXF-14]|uniref:restriction endonuclease subunit S n=1 Tax=Chitinivorax sp. PXF-14 TaxID=3230488 RepID=UPI003466E36E